MTIVTACLFQILPITLPSFHHPTNNKAGASAWSAAHLAKHQAAGTVSEAGRVNRTLAATRRTVISTAARLTACEYTPYNGRSTTNPGFNGKSLYRTIANASSTFHAAVPVIDLRFAGLQLKDLMGTYLPAHTTTNAPLRIDR